MTDENEYFDDASDKPKAKKAKGKASGTQFSKVIGRMIAAGILNANDTVTWGALCHVRDVAEGNAHGAARRAELVEAGVLTN